MWMMKWQAYLAGPAETAPRSPGPGSRLDA